MTWYPNFLPSCANSLLILSDSESPLTGLLRPVPPLQPLSPPLIACCLNTYSSVLQLFVFLCLSLLAFWRQRHLVLLFLYSKYRGKWLMLLALSSHPLIQCLFTCRQVLLTQQILFLLRFQVGQKHPRVIVSGMTTNKGREVAGK